MTISFIGSDTDSEFGEDARDLTLTLPTHAADDFGIIFFSGGSFLSTEVTTPSGWTKLVFTRTTGTFTRSQGIYYRKFTSSSETNPAVAITTGTGSNFDRHASVMVYRGVDTNYPFDVTYQTTADNGSSNNPASWAADDITTITDDCAVLVLLGGRVNANATKPSTYTLAETAGPLSGSNVLVVSAHDVGVGTAGTESPGNWTFDSTGNNWGLNTYTLALRVPQAVIDGDLAKTLGTLTCSSSGLVVDPATEGTLSQTLGTLTSSSAGEVKVEGTASNTLEALTVISAGEVTQTIVTGSLTKTLEDLTSSSTAKVYIVGLASNTLGTLTSSSAASVLILGNFSITLGTLTSSSAGIQKITAILNSTLGLLTCLSAAEQYRYIPVAAATASIFNLEGSTIIEYNPQAGIVTTTYTSATNPTTTAYTTVSSEDTDYTLN